MGKDDDFLKDAEEGQIGIVAEFFEFLRYNKKWWLAPIIVVLLLITGLVLLTASPVAPFIYTLF